MHSQGKLNCFPHLCVVFLETSVSDRIRLKQAFVRRNLLAHN